MRLYFEARDAVKTHYYEGKPGHTHPLLPANWRYMQFKRWLIAYERIDDDMTVHRVVDASRDLAELFERGV